MLFRKLNLDLRNYKEDKIMMHANLSKKTACNTFELNLHLKFNFFFRVIKN